MPVGSLHNAIPLRRNLPNTRWSRPCTRLRQLLRTSQRKSWSAAWTGIIHNSAAQLLFALCSTWTFGPFEGREWEPYRVEGFIEGPWGDAFKRIAAEVNDLYEKRSEKFAENRNREELDEPKKKFGL